MFDKESLTVWKELYQITQRIIKYFPWVLDLTYKLKYWTHFQPFSFVHHREPNLLSLPPTYHIMSPGGQMVCLRGGQGFRSRYQNRFYRSAPAVTDCHYQGSKWLVAELAEKRDRGPYAISRWGDPQLLSIVIYSTVEMETLCTKFLDNISVTSNHIIIQLHILNTLLKTPCWYDQ